MGAYKGQHTGPEIDDAVGSAKGSDYGLMIKMGTGYGARRTLQGSEYIEVLNGDGVNGDPAFSLSADAISKLNEPSFSGVYADLTDKPDLSQYVTTGQLPTPFSGQYKDLAGVPVLATVATSGEYADLSGLPTLFSGAYTDLTDKPMLFSGSYEDLTDKPALGTAASTDSTDYATSAQGAKADTAVQADGFSRMIALTQAEYDALTPEQDTAYFIVEG